MKQIDEKWSFEASKKLKVKTREKMNKTEFYELLKIEIKFVIKLS